MYTLHLNNDTFVLHNCDKHWFRQFFGQNIQKQCFIFLLQVKCLHYLRKQESWKLHFFRLKSVWWFVFETQCSSYHADDLKLNKLKKLTWKWRTDRRTATVNYTQWTLATMSTWNVAWNWYQKWKLVFRLCRQCKTSRQSACYTCVERQRNSIFDHSCDKCGPILKFFLN